MRRFRQSWRRLNPFVYCERRAVITTYYHGREVLKNFLGERRQPYTELTVYPRTGFPRFCVWRSKIRRRKTLAPQKERIDVMKAGRTINKKIPTATLPENIWNDVLHIFTPYCGNRQWSI